MNDGLWFGVVFLLFILIIGVTELIDDKNDRREDTQRFTVCVEAGMEYIDGECRYK